MRNVRAGWAWLTLLLFLSGMAAPRLLAATGPDCPMMRAERERLCRETAKPEPPRPECCVKHESEIARSGGVSGSCCCDMTAAPERSDTPAVLTVIADPIALPVSVAAPPAPRFKLTPETYQHDGNETAPRGPPRRGPSPRAPPFS